jgi:DNA-binding transcriptional ArsR family regulator
MAETGSRGVEKGARRAARGSAAARERRRAVAELRALAHPLRLRLFELFAEAPRTTMQVAVVLGEPPTRLYHHVNALERAGLLRLRETRPNRGTIEKYYESVIAGVTGSGADVLIRSAAGRQSARAAAAAVFEQARQDLFASLAEAPREGDPRPMVLRMIFTASPANAIRVRKHLLALIKKIRRDCAARVPRPGARARKRTATGERYALTIGFAPSWPRRKGGPD